MKLLSLISFVVVLFVLSQCSYLKTGEKEIPPYKEITSRVISQKIEKGFYSKFKDSIIMVIDVFEDKNLVNNSICLLQISFENKKSLLQFKNDSIYSFNNMDLYFSSGNQKYRNLFNKDFKYMAKEIDSFVQFYKSDYTQRWESIQTFQFYFNKKNEISYLETGNDSLYYNLLKDKIKFAPKWNKEPEFIKADSN